MQCVHERFDRPRICVRFADADNPLVRVNADYHVVLRAAACLSVRIRGQENHTLDVGYLHRRSPPMIDVSTLSERAPSGESIHDEGASVMNCEPSEAKNKAAAATSSGRPSRPANRRCFTG
jgi:hypothetical protein